MRTKLKGRLSLLFLSLAMVLAVPAVALADVVKNDVTNDVGVGQIRNYTAGDSATSIGYYIEKAGDCDPANDTPAYVTLQVSKFDNGALDATTSKAVTIDYGLDADSNPKTKLAFTQCNVKQSVKFSTGATAPPGDYQITATATDAGNGDSYNENPATFVLRVSAPASSGGGGGGGGGGGDTGGDACASVTVAAPTFGNTNPTHGTNGWFNEDDGIPTVSASSTTQGATVTYALDQNGTFGTAPTLNEGGTTVYAKATDGNGCSSSVASHTFKVDTVDPMVTPGDVNNTTWRNAALSQAFSASDATSGLADATGDSSFTLTASLESTKDADGTYNPTKVSKTVYDVAGNSTERSLSALIDLTKPDLGITDNNLASYNVCDSARPVEPGFDPSDALSGLLSSGKTWTPNLQPSGVGSYSYSAQAKDNAHNSDSYNKTYRVVYGDAANAGAFSGFLPPINASGTRSTFKLTSTVPVKFELTCNGAPLSNAAAYLTVQKVDPNPDGSVNEAIATDAATEGNKFRYADGKYHFNLSTKSGYTNPNGENVSFSVGTWKLIVSLDDGTTRSVVIDLRK